MCSSDLCSDQAAVNDRPLADDVLQIRGDLAGQGEQEIGILTQFMSQSHDLLFRGRGCLALFDLAQISRLDTDAKRNLSLGEPAIARLPE